MSTGKHTTGCLLMTSHILLEVWYLKLFACPKIYEVYANSHACTNMLVGVMVWCRDTYSRCTRIHFTLFMRQFGMVSPCGVELIALRFYIEMCWSMHDNSNLTSALILLCPCCTPRHHSKMSKTSSKHVPVTFNVMAKCWDPTFISYDVQDVY